jgi:hypothetical protein
MACADKAPDHSLFNGCGDSISQKPLEGANGFGSFLKIY